MMTSYEDDDFYIYEADNYTYPEPPPRQPACDGLCIFIVTINTITFILGSLGNGVVIWITGLRMKRSVNSSWYLSLAVSDFLFCLSLPFNVFYMATGNWMFGPEMCKVLCLSVPLNLYSSIFLLIIISVDRCLCVMFPVWTQNHRTLKASSIFIVLAWTLALILSLPNLLAATVAANGTETKCHLDFHHLAPISHRHVVIVAVLFGFALPLAVIMVCYSLIMVKLRSRNIRSSKPFKVMTAVIATFVVCILPLRVFQVVELNATNHSAFLQAGIRIAMTVAYANSFMNPILYSTMGNEFRSTCYRSLLARMESAFREDGHSNRATSVSISTKDASLDTLNVER